MDIRFSRWLSVAIAAIPFAIVLWVVNQNDLFTPSLTRGYKIGSVGTAALSPVSYDMMVARRSSVDKRLHWYLAGSKLDFTARVPRGSDHVRVTVNLGDLGASFLAFDVPLRSGLGHSRVLVNHPVLDGLPWTHFSSDHLTLWQRPSRIVHEKQVRPTKGKPERGGGASTEREVPIRQYPSFAAFLDDPPDWQRVAVLGVNPLAFARFDDEAAARPVRLEHSFRGNHTFFVYTQPGTFTLSFEKLDLNRKAGRDQLSVNVVRADQLRFSAQRAALQRRVEDDGDGAATGKIGRPQAVSLTIPVAAAGVYQVSLEASEDVLVRNLESSSAYLTFSGSVFLADGPSYANASLLQPLSVSSTTPVRVEAVHESGLQTLTIGRRRFTLTEMKEPVKLDTLADAPLIVSRGDVRLTSDGYLTIQPAVPFLSLGGVPLKNEVAPDLEMFDYVIAEYEPHGNQTPTVIDRSFALADLALHSQSFTFQLETSADRNPGVGVRDVQVKFRRGPIPMSRLLNRFRSIFAFTP